MHALFIGSEYKARGAVDLRHIRVDWILMNLISKFALGICTPSINEFFFSSASLNFVISFRLFSEVSPDKTPRGPKLLYVILQHIEKQIQEQDIIKKALVLPPIGLFILKHDPWVSFVPNAFLEGRINYRVPSSFFSYHPFVTMMHRTIRQGTLLGETHTRLQASLGRDKRAVITPNRGEECATRFCLILPSFFPLLVLF